MHSFAYIDETLDINTSQSYELSIQLSLNGLSFCLLDTVRSKYIALIHKELEKYDSFNTYLDLLENIIENDELLNQQYKKVKLVWLSTKNTLIPANLFSTENLRYYFEFNQILNDLDEIHYNELKYAQAYSVFTIPNQIATIFTRTYPKIKFFNQQSVSIESALYNTHSSDFKAFLNIENDFFDLIITQKGNLILYNNFPYQSENDILYYLIYSFEKLNIQIDKIELILNGNIDKKSSAYLKLNEFIRNIRFDKHSDEHSFSYTFKKTPYHYFSNLFNLNLCE